MSRLKFHITKVNVGRNKMTEILQLLADRDYYWRASGYPLNFYSAYSFGCYNDDGCMYTDPSPTADYDFEGTALEFYNKYVRRRIICGGE